MCVCVCVCVCVNPTVCNIIKTTFTEYENETFLNAETPVEVFCCIVLMVFSLSCIVLFKLLRISVFHATCLT